MTQKTPPAEITIRQACDEDADELAALATLLGYPSTPMQIRERIAQIAADEEHAVLVALQPDGELAGFAHVFTAQRLVSDPFAELGALVVGSKQRGMGIGAVLVREAERWALERGLGCMRIRSNTLRESAKGFYLHLGYDLIKTQNVFRIQLK